VEVFKLDPEFSHLEKDVDVELAFRSRKQKACLAPPSLIDHLSLSSGLQY